MELLVVVFLPNAIPVLGGVGGGEREIAAARFDPKLASRGKRDYYIGCY